jgi:hypothetical protein
MPDALAEWWSYRLSDFLLFAPRTYWRLFELHNAALWPLHVPVVVAGAVALVFALRRPGCIRWIAMLLALIWAFVGWTFIWQRYATINWAASYVAPLFALEAASFAIGGAILGRLPAAPSGTRRLIGALLVGAAIPAYPLLAPMTGRSWAAAEIFGVAPDPTAIATLGFLLQTRGALAGALYPIPLAWCLVSGVTLLTLGENQGWIPLAAALLTLITLVWSRYSMPDRQSSG